MKRIVITLMVGFGIITAGAVQTSLRHHMQNQQAVTQLSELTRK